MAVKPIPEGFHSITPYLLVPEVAKLIDFLKAAFGATERYRSAVHEGRLPHAEVQIGDSRVMMGEPPAGSPAMPAFLYFYVNDVDKVYQQAVDAGATVVSPLRDEFYGDRTCGVKDGSGNTWWIATHKEDVSPEELERRAKGAMKS